MKLHMMTVLALTAALAACGSKTETNQAAAANTAVPAAAENEAMAGNMAMAPTAKMAKASGKVTAIDKGNWPAMTMAFKAAPTLIDSVKVGDEVNFELKLDGNEGEITAISKK